MTSQLDYMFRPRQVAVIGASNAPHKIGFAVLKNILDSGFKGDIFPINPREQTILGLKCYPGIKEAGAVDLAVICVPETIVPGVVKECGETGVKGLIVITAGFKEVGREGLKREKELVELCRRYNIRMLGPNCVGLIDTHTPLNASFVTGKPIPGNISFISQSGAMVISILDWSFSAGLGFSSFISLGNKADLNEIDFIRSSSDDPQTSVILCYIEDVVNGVLFMEAASSASKKKPVIILKSGTSTAGAQAATSHTGALAGSDRAYDIAFEQSGVLRVENMEELFELAIAFSRQTLPRGDRIAIVTNSGGPGIVTTDAIEKAGMVISRFEKETIDFLRENLPEEANVYNPVDVLGDASPERYRLSLVRVLSDKNVDSALVLLTPTAVTDPEETARAIIEARDKYPDKPVFAVYMGGEALQKGKELLSENQVPTYTFPEPAVKAIKGLTRYFRFRMEDKTRQKISCEGDQTAVKAIFYDVLKDRRLVLLGYETSQIAGAYGIPVNPVYLARSIDEARHYSEKLGYPVAMKVASPDIVHKSDVGGVELGLHNAKEVGKAFQRIMKRVRHFLPDTPIYGVEMQKMVDEGIEVIIGMTRDIQFGPLIGFGLGGIYVNLIEDVSFNLASTLDSPDQIEKMIRETKAYSMLKGYRGKRPSDLGTVKKTIAQVAQLSRDFSEITEIDINPLRVYARGAVAVDFKITISHQWN